jgi:hypothetical protein
MGVKKINYHKPTRFAANGFRQALCPLCQDWVYIISYEDDIRWRYGKHKSDLNNKNTCECSYDLVPVDLTRN